MTEGLSSSRIVELNSDEELRSFVEELTELWGKIALLADSVYEAKNAQ